jgi:hypothetical protein
MFFGDRVLGARLREANRDAAYGCLPEIERIMKQIRAAWPEVKIVLRWQGVYQQVWSNLRC